MSDELTKNDELDLMNVKILHSCRARSVKINDVAASVRLGFRWAEAGERAGVFLCTCSARCADPEICGRAWYTKVEAQDPERNTRGRKVELAMPWNARGSREREKIGVWCCDNCEVDGTGAIEDLWVGRFFDLPARLVSFVDIKQARSYSALKSLMKAVYGDAFTEGSFVTLLLYRRTS